MEEIFLEVFCLDDICLAPIETLVVLFTMKYCDSKLKVTLIKLKNNRGDHEYIVNIKNLVHNVLEAEKIAKSTDSCDLPYLKLNNMSFVAGLCACLRHIIKITIAENHDHNCRHLLGFKDSCLLAPSETSVWTKFCEVELISMLRKIDETFLSSSMLPETIARFEMHMSQPVRLHNIYKYTMSKKFSTNGIITQDRNIIPEHLFAEGSFKTLADVFIFICIHAFINLLSDDHVLDFMPLISKWYQRMLEDENIKKCLDLFPLKIHTPKYKEYYLPSVLDESLYKKDTKRYQPGSRIYTKQGDIESSLTIVRDFMPNLELEKEPFGVEMSIDWEKIPHEASPGGGSLPEKRLNKKRQQLENLCKPVLKLAKSNDIIVDFCAGSGHLGILIAYLRPDCTVIILENKEESLDRSKLRVKKLGMTNVRFFQCNLDYFKGDFNIGMSLHACGVATDLVIQHCIRRNAIFVSCPCCYGSIQNCHHITYPRSKIFQIGLSRKNYLVIGHSADQTHDEKNIKTKQGYVCMSIIDTDRKLQAEECGYEVHLAKLIPSTCTPKNHLLVGIPREKSNDEIISDCLNNLCYIQQ